MTISGVARIAEDARGFAAFISYSHADADAAARLQRQLERYRLPKNVALSQERQDRNIGRIFRDREDLAAAPSLSDAIRNALSLSQALIVICSPNARQSRWVEEEIRLFRSLHPERPVLAALVHGEPADSFPDALSEGGLEPLAADLREGADGWQLGFLKIVAGIAAVQLDTLIQRDAQRRVRRVTWITLGALTAMLVMGVMTAFAISARNEAARQRASAEGLVEYMLTDLREKLRGVGRIDVMEGVNARAMEHYRRQGDLANLPADSLERRARILHAMGEDEDNIGQVERAYAKFVEAHRATAALLAREPDNPERIFAHAQSEYWVGQAAWRYRDRATTAKYWQGYLDLSERLLKIDKNRARANLEMGYALGNLSDLYVTDSFDLKKALDYSRRSVAFLQKAERLDPNRTEIKMTLANRYGWLAEVLAESGLYSEAVEARKAELAIIDRLLAADPRNFELRFRHHWPQYGLAAIKIKQGAAREGLADLDRIERQFAAFAQEAPDNLTVKRATAQLLRTKIDALVDIDPAAARVSLEKAYLLVDEMSKTPGQAQSLRPYRAKLDETRSKLRAGGRHGRN